MLGPFEVKAHPLLIASQIGLFVVAVVVGNVVAVVVGVVVAAVVGVVVVAGAVTVAVGAVGVETFAALELVGIALRDSNVQGR